PDRARRRPPDDRGRLARRRARARDPRRAARLQRADLAAATGRARQLAARADRRRPPRARPAPPRRRAVDRRGLVFARVLAAERLSSSVSPLDRSHTRAVANGPPELTSSRQRVTARARPA